ncbi:hypothetical protein WMF38_52235 [Sorangium sp. So ce118]
MRSYVRRTTDRSPEARCRSSTTQPTALRVYVSSPAGVTAAMRLPQWSYSNDSVVPSGRER